MKFTVTIGVICVVCIANVFSAPYRFLEIINRNKRFTLQCGGSLTCVTASTGNRFYVCTMAGTVNGRIEFMDYSLDLYCRTDGKHYRCALGIIDRVFRCRTV